MLATHAFGVPLRGSYFALFVLSSAFLVPAFGQGLLISTGTRSQFVASQVAAHDRISAGVHAVGLPVRDRQHARLAAGITYIVPARYFVASLQTVFLAGDVWAQFMPNILAMLAIGAVFFSSSRANPQEAGH